MCIPIVVLSEPFSPVAPFLSSHKPTLQGFNSRGIVARVAEGGAISGGTVVLAAHSGLNVVQAAHSGE